MGEWFGLMFRLYAIGFGILLVVVAIIAYCIGAS